jgi:hypothetical protein
MTLYFLRGGGGWNPRSNENDQENDIRVEIE